MEVSQIIEEKVKQAVEELYFIKTDCIHVEHPSNEAWGDFSTNIALSLAKDLNQSPAEIAKNISYRLADYETKFEFQGIEYKIFDEIYFAPLGFINFRLSKEWLQNVLYVIQAAPNIYGVFPVGAGLRIALEHSNVNPNKAAHIGHLRNACIGQFIERVYEFLGYEVEVQYYVNDLGVQVATSVMGMDKIKDIRSENYDKFDHFAWDVYARMEAQILQDPQLQRERSDLLIKLEDSKSPESLRQKDLAKKILFEQLKTFQKLDIDYDVVVKESDILSLRMWDKAFLTLKANENVYMAESGKSAGCWLVRLGGTSTDDVKDRRGEVEEDKIIVRSNGVPTYTGKDIAYHMWKFGVLGMDFFYKKLNSKTQEKPLWITSDEKADFEKGISFSGVSRVFDVIGSEQTYAMDVVKKSLSYLGYKKESDNMNHINYGFVYLSPATAKQLGIDVSDGKNRYGMSGRKGWGVKVDDLIDIIDVTLKNEHGDFESLSDVRNGAIKFEMLKINTFQDMIFDLKSSMNIKGYTGPYIQYTHARASSVLKKADYRNKNDFYDIDLKAYSETESDLELAFLRQLYKFPEIVKRSAFEFAPQLLCEYLYELSQRYNNLYNYLPILSAESDMKKNSRLLMTKCVKDVIKTGLYLLGISAPEKM